MNIMPLIVINSILAVIVVLLSIAEHYLVSYGECEIDINEKKAVRTRGGSYLLGVLYANKIYIPSACGGKATCGQCKVQIMEGAGPILPTEEVFISGEEKNSGVRLACQVKIKNDLKIHIPEHLLEAKEYRAAVTQIIQLTHDIKHIRLKLEDPPNISFKPGQYIQFLVPGTDEFRAYSIASPPSQTSEIELVVRHVPGGLCSTYIHQVLTAGDRVVMTGPFGDFFLREESERDIIGVIGGCGMAPLRSIILHLAERNMPRRVTLFFGARSKRDLFFTRQLSDLQKKYPNFRFIPALSEPKPEDKWEGETGLVTDVVEKHIQDGSRYEGYLCGPPPMIDAAIEVLNKKGMDEKNIYYDKF
ncbi:MAG: NADH:ubiquinone reductase (Na(+)-transporting) subunit F [Spirochaetota bacterium]